jgi:hypothetical protein
MGDSYDCGPLELLPDHLLHEGIGAHIDVRSGLIEYQEAVLS